MDKSLPETLRKMMTAMSESDRENPSLWGMGVVAVTIFVKFLHSLAQKELSVMVLDVYTDISPAIFTILLASIQVGVAVSVFRVSGLNVSTSPTHREAAIIGLLSYAGGLFLFNYLLWSDDTAATAFYGVQEPALCMLLLFVAARIPTETNKAGAVGCFCFGAALLSARITLLGGINSLLRVLASVFLLVRNMVVKHLYDSSVTFLPRGQNTLLAVAAGGTVGSVLVAALISRDLLVAALMAVVCAVLCVTLLHLLLTLLSLYDTLTVAVFMLWSQVLENVVLVGEDSRPALLAVLLGSVLFAAGHYVYFKDGLDSGTVHLNIKQVGVNELFTRLQFILYAAAIVGLLATLIKPYLSDHEGSILSYVGLDNIARRLLSVQSEEQ